MDTAVTERVRTNLVHYNLWQDVELHDMEGWTVIRGTPSTKLDSRDADGVPEWVVARTMSDPELSVGEIATWFNDIEKKHPRPARVTVGIEQDDGTVVYYFVHEGVVKPRQN